MIIGGGVAGMAAAKKLNDHGITVHLIEKNDHLGGNASSWACMATDTCQHCGACLSAEMAHQTAQMANVNTHLNAEVLKIDTVKNKYSAQLRGMLQDSTSKAKRMKTGKAKADQIISSCVKNIAAPCLSCHRQIGDISTFHKLGVKVDTIAALASRCLVLPSDQKRT